MSKLPRNQKYKITGELVPIIGYADKHYKEGNVTALVTQFNFFNTLEMPDEKIQEYKMHIHDLLTNTVFPIILDSYSGKKLPSDIRLGAVYIEYFGTADASKSRILINEDAEIAMSCEVKPGVRISKNGSWANLGQISVHMYYA